MESSRGRPRPELDLLTVVEQQASIPSGWPTRTPCTPSSAPSGSGEEVENVAVASRHHSTASLITSGGSIGPRPEREAWQEQSGSGTTPSGSGGRRGTPGSEYDPPLSSRPPGNTELGEERPAWGWVCRRGGAGGVEMNAELAPREEEDHDHDDEEDEEAAGAGRAGRSFSSRLQDSRSLDGLSGACGGGGAAAAAGGAAEPGAGGGRRATISSPLELEGTVSRHGDLTHFVANNLQLKIRLSGAPPPLPPAPVRPCQTPAPTPTIPPIDPDVLRDLERLSRDLGGRVDRLLRGLGGAVQELTALSVGCIQTYRDAVDSLGEAVDMSIKGMYTLLARCEELERALQPVQGLARQVRDIRRTLEVLEALCK
uniref:BLOC-1-related complex subunit 6 n=1 Tax=Jaculus jaculus TaxID=51337 RepID=UPI001E1B60B8|nr:BLOC-1-related complex subunit 6 [Jaculus jaculus]